MTPRGGHVVGAPRALAALREPERAGTPISVRGPPDAGRRLHQREEGEPVPARTIRLVRASLLPLTLLGALAVPGQASAGRPGTIEICKNGQDGVTGTFQFRLNGGAAFSVPVGGCSGPMTTHSGSNTVTEVAPADA